MNAFSEAELTLYCILGLRIVEGLWDNYISFRQVKVCQTALKVPDELKGSITEETFHKSRVYMLEKEQFSIFRNLLMDICILCLELYFGVMAVLWQTSIDLVLKCNWNAENEIVVSCIFCMLISIVSLCKDLPFKLYSTFVIEEKHGFNKQTLPFFAWDQVKYFVVMNLISTPIMAAFIFIVQRGGSNFFIWLWAFSAVVSLIMITLYPTFIAPLFDKYTPLEEGPLRNSIEELAASLKYPLTNLYVVDGSKRSSHSNAYLYGLWNSKRIVLYDTLLLNKGKPHDSELKEEEKGKGCTDEEVLAVLGHELGHWKLGHVIKNMAILQVHMLVSFAAFGYLFHYEPFYEAVGFAPGTRPVIVGMLVILTHIFSPFNAVVSFGLMILSRRFEYQADEFSSQLGFTKMLKRALVKLNIDNLGFPINDWLYTAWSHSHPTLLQRLERLNEYESSDKREKKTN